MTFLWIKQSVKLFLMLFKTPYRETLARYIIPFSQWVQASSKGSPPRGIIGFACKQHFSYRPPKGKGNGYTPLTTFTTGRQPSLSVSFPTSVRLSFKNLDFH